MKNAIFTSEYILQMSRELEHHHAVFYRFWNMGAPIETNEIDTAAVSFSETGDFLEFLINPKFWEGKSITQQAFYICHEALHILLNHGLRSSNKGWTDTMNIAADLVVNHSLVSRFGFDRAEVDPKNKLCWVDTVFPFKEVATDLTFEQYFQLLQTEEYKLMKILDDHDSLENSKEILKKFNEEATDEEKQTIEEFIKRQEPTDLPASSRGDSPGNIIKFIPKEQVSRKKKWETVIKNWAVKFIKNSNKDNEQWARINRRFVMLPDDMFLPSEMEVEEIEKEKHKIEVWFFQDTSGSCSGFAKRFFRAAESLPKDRFNVRMHCFDTRVYETSLVERKLYGFGGTSFTCIENYIQRTIAKEGIKYPKAVFVITDGDGNKVHPQMPEVWHWFLSCNDKSCIPKESKTYLLRNFE
jgi:predicted metal-dependent peptidase